MLRNIVAIALFSSVLMVPQIALATYVPNSGEQKFSEHLSKQPFAKAVAWSQKGSLWVSVMHETGTNADLYEQLAYGICADAKTFGLADFYIHIWDARAMVAGNMKRLTDRVRCE